MPFNSGTGITDHIALLDKLTEVVTSRYLESVAVNAGGTGYVVGDILGIDGTGATSTIVAQVEVTSVSGGVVDGVRVYRSGAYTVDPTTTTGNTTTGGTGSGCTVDLTMAAPTWVVNRRTQEGLSATVSSPGTGYNVNDKLTVASTLGGFFDADLVFNVDTLTGGPGSGVATVSVDTGFAGNFEETPANPVSPTTGGGGSGCQLTVTYQDGTFAENEGQVCMLEGEGLAGTDEIHVILRPYSLDINFDTAYNWALLGCTGYNALLPIHQQLGVNNNGSQNQIESSDGDLPSSDRGSYLVLKNDDADPDMEWWINHNGRRIIMVVKVESNTTTQYSSMYVGFLNQTATSSEYPYPLCILSGTTDRDRLWTESSLLSGGIVESISNGTGDPVGPGYILTPAGLWLPFAAENSNTSSFRSVETEFGVFPFLNPTFLTGADQIVAAGSDVGFTTGAHEIIPPSGVPGTETILLKPTPGTGDDYYWLVAPLVIREENSGLNLFPEFHNMFGEIDGVFWFTTGGNAIVSEDRFELSDKRYLIFQNGNRTQNWSYFALDED